MKGHEEKHLANLNFLMVRKKENIKPLRHKEKQRKKHLTILNFLMVRKKENIKP